MIDGDKDFRSISEKMNEAKNSIYKTSHDTDPELQLVRGNAVICDSRQLICLRLLVCKNYCYHRYHHR